MVASTIQQEWTGVLSPADWDREFPGILDGIGLLGGTANVIMQLAHPAVGYGVKESRVESGSIIKHPFKRTRTTLTYLGIALTGSTEEKLAYRRAVSRAHAQVTSTPQSPVAYRALDNNLQLWVAACTLKGFLDSYDKFQGGMSLAQRQRFYDLAKPLGTTLQVRPEDWPASYEAFEAFFQQGLNQAQIDDTIREFLMVLVDMRFMPAPVRLLFGRLNRLMTVSYLPPTLREQMQLKWTSKDQLDAARLEKIIGHSNRLMPRVIRQLPHLYFMWDIRRRLRNQQSLI
ncbi:MAG: oxygenase MpaB family protein [Moraxellaceae bacterium]|nr:oxygenase MpaB family protein [Moraxellaceae bacterium]